MLLFVLVRKSALKQSSHHEANSCSDPSSSPGNTPLAPRFLSVTSVHQQLILFAFITTFTTTSTSSSSSFTTTHQPKDNRRRGGEERRGAVPGGPPPVGRLLLRRHLDRPEAGADGGALRLRVSLLKNLLGPFSRTFLTKTNLFLLSNKTQVQRPTAAVSHSLRHPLPKQRRRAARQPDHPSPQV